MTKKMTWFFVQPGKNWKCHGKEYLANLQLVKTVEDQKGGDPKSPIEAQG